MTATPPDLPGFLLARIAEDEHDAHLAASQREPEWFLEEVPPQSWGYDDPEPVIISKGKPIIKITDYNPCAAWHVERWDPARVLAECAAKRAIVERCARFVNEPDPVGDNGLVSPRAVLARQTLAALAQPYADHPDFDSAWRA